MDTKAKIEKEKFPSLKMAKLKISCRRKSQLIVSRQVVTSQWCSLVVIFCGFISHLIGCETINIPEIFSGVHDFRGKTVNFQGKPCVYVRNAAVLFSFTLEHLICYKRNKYCTAGSQLGCILCCAWVSRRSWAWVSKLSTSSLMSCQLLLPQRVSLKRTSEAAL